MGEGDAAIDTIKKAIRLNPKHHKYVVAYLALAYLTAGRYQDVIKTIEPHYEWFARRGWPIMSFFAAAHAATDQDEKARNVMKAYLAKKRGLTLSRFSYVRLYKRPEDRLRVTDLLRKAGMPE